MMQIQISPGWMTVSVVATLISGLLALTWGRRIPRNGDWLVGLGLGSLLVLSLLNWVYFVEHTPAPLVWPLGWIWPREDSVALNVGILQDGIGLTFTLLSSVIALVMLTTKVLLKKEQRPERLFAATAISTSGVALAWMSLTPWLSILGVTITLLGGFSALSISPKSDSDAAVASRFGRERGWGLILALFGAWAMTSSGYQMNFSEPLTAAAGVGANYSFWLPALLLVAGFFLQTHPFPLLGWTVMPSDSTPAARTVFSQVFPAWAAFATLFRLEPFLRGAEVFPLFGWIALVSAVLATGTGLLVPGWKQSLSAWLSAAFSVSVAALAFSGPRVGLVIMLSVGLSATVIAILGSALETGSKNGSKDPSGKKRADWIKVGSLISAAGATGMLGFASAGGMIQWLIDSASEPAEATVIALALLLVALLCWKLVWSFFKLSDRTQIGWANILLPIAIQFLSLGVFWSGRLTGQVLPGSPDRVMPSLLDRFFNNWTLGYEADERFMLATWLHWGPLVLAIATAYWSTAMKHPTQDKWDQLRRAFPRATSFFIEGYGVDRLASRFLFGTKWIGSGIQTLVDGRFWSSWAPKGLDWGLTCSSRWVAQADLGITKYLELGLRRGTEVPAKMLQLVQSGNVQWYLFFAVGSGLAILIHFLRF